MAYQWAKDLELSYIPSNFIIRSAFIKGMVAVFDFHQFAEKFAQADETGKHKLKDCYGNEHYIEDVDVLLTVSQFKMWKKYMSLEEYNGYAKMYGHVWGVSKFPKAHDKEYSLINYQYIQTLDMDDNDIADLTGMTEDWLHKICSGDELYTKLFAYGVGSEKKGVDAAPAHTDTGYIKALCADFDLFNENII